MSRIAVEVGAGFVEITISNQTDSNRSITLEGKSIIERADVAPGDGHAPEDAQAGSYEVKAGSKAVAEIRPPCSASARSAELQQRLLLP